MIIFGIDPGTAVTGYGVIEARGTSVSCKACGTITTASRSPLAARLQQIYDRIALELDACRPQRVAIEQAFYAKNVHTTLLLGHARGVLMLAARQCGAEVAEYSPREIKKAVTGSGGAEKTQVTYMVKALLSPPAEYEHSDAYDALAVALCDFFHAGNRSILQAKGVRERAGALA